ncbi:hypothetical protein SAMN05216505_111223 [Streptomyces prasinopilosus]|uniref:Uncharacterized protein n=1 Tax=Streptomyces prasinopilosus TaxID=67344 RepID=A0A1G6XIP2_9ACTN|nr:hypothetical protein SAMN05216505_111223 [Streptomyces prasinopilosus]
MRVARKGKGHPFSGAAGPPRRARPGHRRRTGREGRFQGVGPGGARGRCGAPGRRFEALTGAKAGIRAGQGNKSVFRGT